MNTSAIDFPKLLEAFGQFITQIGPLPAVAILSYLGFNVWIYILYNGRLNDRQKEIDRLAEENREYRERFLQLVDNKVLNGSRRKSKANPSLPQNEAGPSTSPALPTPPPASPVLPTPPATP